MISRTIRRATVAASPWRVAPAVLALCLAVAQPVYAEDGDRPGGGDDLGTVLDETTTTVLRMFQTFMKAIPQFEAPEVLPNGDIIIRRKQPGQPVEPDADDPEESETRRI